MISEAGYSARIEYAKGSWFRADDEIIKRLALPEGSNILKIEKLFYADNTPAVYMDDYVPEEILININFHKEDFGIPIFRLIREKSGLAAETVLVEVDACPISDEIAEELKLEFGTTLLAVHELAYTFDSKPIFLSNVYYRSGLFKMTLLRKIYMRW
jgi:GntR family transcriptional regulator